MGYRSLMIASVGAVAVAGVLGFGPFGNEPEPPSTPTSEPENVEPALTEYQKQRLFLTGAHGVYNGISEAVSYGLMSDAQADEINTAARTISFETKPDELLQVLEAVDDGSELYKSSIRSSDPNAPYNYTSVPPALYEIQSAFTEYLSPELNILVTRVGGDNGCIGRFDQPDKNEDYISSVRAHMPDGVRNMKCENGTDVNVLVYGAGEVEDDVKVSYDFEHAVAYFEKTGPYALENCDDANDCFSAISFTDLEGSAGLAQAFADKTQAEESLTEVKTQAQDYFAKAWPQIQTDMAEVIKPAAPAPR